MQSNLFSSMKVLFVAAVLVLTSGSFAFADGDDRYVPRKRAAVAAPVATPAVQEAPAPAIMHEEAQMVVEDDSCGCNNFRASLGVPVWFFNQEGSNLPGSGAALDYWCDELPVNFRVGVEGRHMYLGQSSADFGREFADKTTRVTFIRIPFSVEYMHSLTENTTGYIGGGPDIIHLANDITETGVGMHLGARLHYAFTKHVGVSLEAGYMWGSVDGEAGRDVRLDNAYITPMLAYTF